MAWREREEREEVTLQPFSGKISVIQMTLQHVSSIVKSGVYLFGRVNSCGRPIIQGV